MSNVIGRSPTFSGWPQPAVLEGAEANAWAELQEALPVELRTTLRARVVRDGIVAILITPGADVLAINRVIGLGCDRPLSERRLDALMSTYRDAGVKRFVVQWAEDPVSSDHLSLFQDRGFRIGTPTLRLCLRTTSEMSVPLLDAGLRVREVDDEMAEVYESTVAPVLGVPPEVAVGIRSTVGQRKWRYYLVFDGDRPIAGGAMHVHGDVAWCGLTATIASDRRRGAQKALIHRRSMDARNLGCEWIMADTMPDSDSAPNWSYRNLIEMGFQHLYERTHFIVNCW